MSQIMSECGSFKESRIVNYYAWSKIVLEEIYYHLIWYNT